jgi:hypothetical protein
VVLDSELLRHLETDRVVRSYRLPVATHCSAAILVVELEGGTKAFWKRGDADPPGVIGVRNEVAAYEVACLLGWDKMLQATVLRRERSAEGAVVEVAASELLPEGLDDLAPDQFSVEQRQRAGAFDALIAQSDRMGHNWRGVPMGGGEYRLKLYDHELALKPVPDLSPVRSSFWDLVGRSVPPPLKAELGAAANQIAGSPRLRQLLSEEARAALLERLRILSD